MKKMFVRSCVVFLLLHVLVYADPITQKLQKNEEEDDEIIPYPNRRVREKAVEEMEAEHNKTFWRENALVAVKDRIHRRINQNTAKNVIMFLGDGMSIPTIAAARVYIGGEERQLSFEKFPYTGLSKFR
ncbi:hypothetical protein NQ317_005658 [Molorchus minor]|uniref:alkaline phosphatase n=1 Tax=Molorchus minor TaxID=1323400 RepID=A0ABQ9K8I9_9CUCU|nr:hypothetical protein NQ317_005658 [Molorchus minor]